ncbi:MAG: segregation/condensation protein A [Syntrophomonas sp.]
MDYIVDLEAFHGPLDLLLYLIDKNELDIYDIPIAAITDQYMEYLKDTGEYDLEVLGDFLIMASYLLNLKSRLLLPGLKGEAENTEEEALDPREELVQRLLEYKRIKKVAELLMERQSGECKRIFFRDVIFQAEEKEEIWASIAALTRAYQSVFCANDPRNVFTIPQGDVNVTEKMEELLERLRIYKKGIIFQDLFAGVLNKREALAFFLALLELVRQRRVTAWQEKGFSDIKVYLQVAEYDVNA